jgi:hypothetical protein
VSDPLEYTEGDAAGVSEEEEEADAAEGDARLEEVVDLTGADDLTAADLTGTDDLTAALDDDESDTTMSGSDCELDDSDSLHDSRKAADVSAARSLELHPDSDKENSILAKGPARGVTPSKFPRPESPRSPLAQVSIAVW